MTDVIEVRAAEVEAHVQQSIPETCLQMLRALAAGWTSKQAARRLGISYSAAVMRVHRANQHLGTATAVQAVYEASQRGLLGRITPIQRRS
jgi:DNA-binding NarL/FixJ family response regulator